MIFQDSFITEAGTALLARVTAGEGNLVWTTAATSSLDTESYSEEDMEGITAETFGAFTSSGWATSTLRDGSNNTVDVQCELSNDSENGYARTFGVWAKVEGDAEDVLILVARCGAGVTPININPVAQGMVRLFVDFTLEIDDHQAQAIAVTESYYASAQALAATNRVVEDVSTHYFRMYRNVWEALALSSEGEKFVFFQDTDSPIEFTSIDEDTFGMITIQACYDGLLFCWYTTTNDGSEPAHAVILSIERLRHGNTTSLFNDTSIIGMNYMAGGAPEPIYVDDSLILYGDPNVFSTIHAVVRDGNAFTYAGTVSISYGSIPEVEALRSDMGEMEGMGGMSEPVLDSIYMTKAGTVVKFTDSMSTSHAYVIGIHCTKSDSIVTINTYDKGVTSSADWITKIGECSGKYFGVDSSGALYLETSGSFEQVTDTSGSSIYSISMPPHNNAFLFASYDSIYGMTEFSASPKCRKLYETTQGLFPNDFGTSQGIICPTGGIGVTPYGLFPMEQINYSAFSAGGIGLTYTTERYQTLGEYKIKVTLAAFPGDYSLCIRRNRQVFPLLK